MKLDMLYVVLYGIMSSLLFDSWIVCKCCCACAGIKVITHTESWASRDCPFMCICKYTGPMQGCHAHSSHSQLFGFYDHHQDDYVTQNSKHRHNKKKKSRDEFHHNNNDDDDN